MHWGSGIFGCFSHFYFFAHIFGPFPPHLLFFRLMNMVILFEGACYRTSYFPPHFSGPLSLWISKLGIGCSAPAPMARDLLPRWLGRLKTDSSLGILPRWVESGESAMQEGVHLFCHPKFRLAT